MTTVLVSIIPKKRWKSVFFDHNNPWLSLDQIGIDYGAVNIVIIKMPLKQAVKQPRKHLKDVEVHKMLQATPNLGFPKICVVHRTENSCPLGL